MIGAVGSQRLSAPVPSHSARSARQRGPRRQRCRPPAQRVARTGRTRSVRRRWRSSRRFAVRGINAPGRRRHGFAGPGDAECRARILGRAGRPGPVSLPLPWRHRPWREQPSRRPAWRRHQRRPAPRCAWPSGERRCPHGEVYAARADTGSAPAPGVGLGSRTVGGPCARPLTADLDDHRDRLADLR